MLTQQNTQQLSKQGMADASSSDASPLPIPEDMTEQQIPESVENETTVLGAINQAEPLERDFDGLDLLPELAENPAQSLDEVFVSASEETRVVIEDENTAEEEDVDMPSEVGQTGSDLERTLAYQDGRSQPAAAVGQGDPANAHTDEPGPDGTARVAALDDTQLRPYAIDPHPDGGAASALREDDDLAYGLSQETHERPVSRIGRIITIIVAGLLVAIVAYAITSIILYGGLRLPSSSPIPAAQSSNTNNASKADSQESVSVEEAASQEDWQQPDEGGTTSDESTSTVEYEGQTEPEADTWTDEGDATASADTATVETSETETPVDGGGEEAGSTDQGAEADVSSEEPAADVPSTSDESVSE